MEVSEEQAIRERAQKRNQRVLRERGNRLDKLQPGLSQEVAKEESKKVKKSESFLDMLPDHQKPETAPPYTSARKTQIPGDPVPSSHAVDLVKFSTDFLFLLQTVRLIRVFVVALLLANIQGIRSVWRPLGCFFLLECLLEISYGECSLCQYPIQIMGTEKVEDERLKRIRLMMSPYLMSILFCLPYVFTSRSQTARMLSLGLMSAEGAILLIVPRIHGINIQETLSPIHVLAGVTMSIARIVDKVSDLVTESPAAFPAIINTIKYILLLFKVSRRITSDFCCLVVFVALLSPST